LDERRILRRGGVTYSPRPFKREREEDDPYAVSTISPLKGREGEYIKEREGEKGTIMGGEKGWKEKSTGKDKTSRAFGERTNGERVVLYRGD